MKRQSTIALLGAAFSLLAVGHVARAASIGAYAGHALSPAQATCFGETGGGVINLGTNSPLCNNGGQLTWEVPLFVDINSFVTPLVNITYNENGPTPSCETIAATNNAITLNVNTWVFAEQTGVDFDPDGVTVPQDGYLYMACRLNPGNTWHVTDFIATSCGSGDTDQSPDQDPGWQNCPAQFF